MIMSDIRITKRIISTMQILNTTKSLTSSYIRVSIFELLTFTELTAFVVTGLRKATSEARQSSCNQWCCRIWWNRSKKSLIELNEYCSHIERDVTIRLIIFEISRVTSYHVCMSSGYHPIMPWKSFFFYCGRDQRIGHVSWESSSGEGLSFKIIWISVSRFFLCIAVLRKIIFDFNNKLNSIASNHDTTDSVSVKRSNWKSMSQDLNIKNLKSYHTPSNEKSIISESIRKTSRAQITKDCTWHDRRVPKWGTYRTCWMWNICRTQQITNNFDFIQLEEIRSHWRMDKLLSLYWTTKRIKREWDSCIFWQIRRTIMLLPRIIFSPTTVSKKKGRKKKQTERVRFGWLFPKSKLDLVFFFYVAKKSCVLYN